MNFYEQKFIHKRFQNPESLAESNELTSEIYKIIKKFPKFETHIIVSQLLRACTSIGANIAKGTHNYIRAVNIYH